MITMKINKKFIPIKLHYLCFLGSMSPILPFLIVVGLQLGIPVSVMGTLLGVSLLLVVLMKPIIATLADAFPAYRRAIFLMTLFITTVAYSSLDFVPPMRGGVRAEGRMVMPVGRVHGGRQYDTTLYASSSSSPPPPATNPLATNPPATILPATNPPATNLPASNPLATNLPATNPPASSTATTGGNEEAIAGHLLLLTHNEDDCYVSVAWDCVVSCVPSNASTTPTIITRIRALAGDLGPEGLGARETPNSYKVDGVEGSPFLLGDVGRVDDDVVSGRLYGVEGFTGPWDPHMTNISLRCEGGQWVGGECEEAWSYWPFWFFTMLVFMGQIAFNVALSVTDAIIVDSIGVNGDYGLQRAWGTVGWGLMGPISGLLIDWWSGTSVTKDYTPAFLICFLLGTADVILSAVYIKVPQMKTDRNILKKVIPIVRQPKFFVFCCFVILNGSFDGIVANYIFIMQESMAHGTSAMAYMKFLQGFTLFVQCGTEVPFMFVNNWVMRKLGAHYVISMVFFLYIFRLLGLAVVGAYGPVWSTLLVELLNGPCYGLGYTSIIVHAANLSPPGTSTTVQSVINLCYESIGYALSVFVGGHLFSALGGPGLYLTAGLIALITFILHFIWIRFLFPAEEAENATVPLEKEDGNMENAVMSAEDLVQRDAEGNTATREKEVSAESGVCNHSATDVEMTQEPRDLVEHL
ncbi:uncharacterized protein [Panulirus ornatus]|uniref:uncharacterized protein isoform X2 n=1 Tax=Panulirus ornatus TaxID=150431 RepID=UPI003A887099